MKLKFDCWTSSTKCVITATNSRHRVTGSDSAEKACSNQITTVQKLKQL